MNNQSHVRIAMLVLALFCTGAASLHAQETVPCPPPAQGSLTIDEAVRTALDRNTTVRAQRDEVQAARARIGQAEADRLPQVRAGVQYTHNTNVGTVEIPSPDPAVPSRTVTIGAQDQTALTVTARQAVYTGGRVGARVSQAEALFDVAVAQSAVTEAQVALQTRQAYYNVLRNQALVQSAEQNLESARRQFDDATARYEAGTAARFDVLRAQTQVSEAEQSLVEARNQVEIARVALNRILNAPLDANYVLVDPGLAPTPAEDLPALITTAEQQRPELLASRARVAAAEQGIRIARSERLPQIGLSANYQALAEESAGQASGWTFIANADVEVFTGGRIRANVREAQALRNQARTNLEDTTLEVSQDVRNAFLNLRTARQTLDTAAARLAQAQEAYEIAIVRYQAGVGTATEQADALAALTAARTNQANARYNYNIAFASLQKALGLVQG